MIDPVFPEHLPSAEIFRGTIHDIGPNVDAYRGPHSLPDDPAKPLVLIRFPK